MNFAVLPQDLQIFKHLPTVLHRFIYHFIYDEVKVYYWLEKYCWESTLHDLRDSFYGVCLLEKYYFHTQTLNDMSKKFNEYFRRDKIKWRDSTGTVTRVKWIWDDDYADYDMVFSDFTKYLREQSANKQNMHGLYKYFAHLIVLYNDIYKT